jgi:hypothetical protein
MSHPTQPDAERAHNAVLRAESEQPLVRLNQPMPPRRTPPLSMTCPLCESLSIVRGDTYRCLGCRAEWVMTPV